MITSTTQINLEAANWLDVFLEENPKKLFVDPLPNDNHTTAKDLTGLDLCSISIIEYVKRGVFSAQDLKDFTQLSLDEFIDAFQKLREVGHAIQLIQEILPDKGKILIASDYDVDGVTSSTIFNSYFNSINHNCKILNLTPRRHSEGYGLTEGFVKRIIKKRPDLVIFLDMGTGAKEQVSKLRSSGIEVIILDHHQVIESSILGNEAIFINPQRNSDETIFKQNSPCAGLLSYLFVEALKVNLGGNTEGLVTLAAAATICDISPASRLNRATIVNGFSIESVEKCKIRLPGFAVLLEELSIDEFNPKTAGFIFGPAINAAGRMIDHDLANSSGAIKAIKVLLSEKYKRTIKIAGELVLLNQQRRLANQNNQTIILEKNIKLTDSQPAIIIFDSRIDPAVCGIDASRIARATNRPTFIGGIDSEGNVKFSARNLVGLEHEGKLSLAYIQNELKDCLLSSGGHWAASGGVIKNCKVEEFTERLQEICAQRLNGYDLTPFVYCSQQVELSAVKALKTKLYSEFSLLQPFDVHTNPEPLILISDCKLVGFQEFISKKGRKYYKLAVNQNGCREIIFDFRDQKEQWKIGSNYSFAVKVSDEMLILEESEIYKSY